MPAIGIRGVHHGLKAANAITYSDIREINYAYSDSVTYNDADMNTGTKEIAHRKYRSTIDNFCICTKSATATAAAYSYSPVQCVNLSPVDHYSDGKEIVEPEWSINNR